MILFYIINLSVLARGNTKTDQTFALFIDNFKVEYPMEMWITGCGDSTWMILENSVTLLGFLYAHIQSYQQMTHFPSQHLCYMASAQQYSKNLAIGLKGK